MKLKVRRSKLKGLSIVERKQLKCEEFMRGSKNRCCSDKKPLACHDSEKFEVLSEYF